MFNLFKPEEMQKVQGKVDRIGAAPDAEFTLNYVIKLKNHPTIFTVDVYRSSPNKNELALTRENDEIVFHVNKKNVIKLESFKNLSFLVNENV